MAMLETWVNTTVMPPNQRTVASLADAWSATAIQYPYTKLTAQGGIGNAIDDIVFGKSTLNPTYGVAGTPTYNDPATFGGQTTPSTVWLSTAQDDSWEPRYQTAGTYQQTTQVPTQQAPFMTHVYSETIGDDGTFMSRIVYVIDDNNFVVYDPQRYIAGNAYENLRACNQNSNAVTNLAITIPTGVNFTVWNPDGTNYGATTTDQTVLEFKANQEGIVEPFLFQSDNPVYVSITY